MTNKIISGDREIAVDTMQVNGARAAAGLEALGLKPGDAIATFLRNDIPNFEVGVAASMLGLYAVPINWHYGAEEAGYVLEDCAARVLVVHSDLLPGIAAGIPAGVKVFVVETPPEIAAAYGLSETRTRPPVRAELWDDWRAGFEPHVPTDVPDPGSMIYTSGTTGRPKGVRRQPTDPSQMIERFRVINMAFGLRPGARTIIPAPMYHSAPNAYSYLSVQQNAERIVLMPRFDPEELLRQIDRHRITHLQVVPTMFVRLLKLDPAVRAKYDVSSLEFVVHAAAPCAPEVKRQMIEWWGPVINEYYGSTETAAVVFCNSEQWLAHPGTVGTPLPGAKVQILDEEGNEQPVGVPGDVCARIMNGPDFTYNNDDEKRKRSERQGLIMPGDIGFFDEDGFLYLCDRRNDMVISGGVNIYPAEIEACLISNPAIADCAVFGIPDDEFGESLAAYVQPRPGADIGEDDVRAHIRSHLASYKVPKVVRLVDTLPREDSGKIFKRKLRDPYWEGRQRQI